MPKHQAMKAYKGHRDEAPCIVYGGIPSPAALSPKMRAASTHFTRDWESPVVGMDVVAKKNSLSQPCSL